MSKYILRPKVDNSATFSVRVHSDLLKEFDKLSKKTRRSRNELINTAMQYFLSSVETQEEPQKTK